MKKVCDIDPAVLSAVRHGTVIPAQVLALNGDRTFAPKYQRALCRYFIDSGVGGIAVGVHSTQFAIRDPKFGLFEPVMRETSHFIDEWCRRQGRKILKVGGVCGRTGQAVREAEFEAANGYDAALLSLAAFQKDSTEVMLEHCREVAKVMPLIGFYLQPGVGGRVLPLDFWREFVRIENVLAIKMAPFNRYYTLDVVRALAESGRDDITLYTGNDDNLLIDLLSEYEVNGKKLRIKGGLLGHWSVWTRRAVELLNELHGLYFPDADVYCAIVPDKNYYLASSHGYPALDYETLFGTVEAELPWATHIDLTGSLTAADYYATDSHWRQERLDRVIQTLAQAMDLTLPDWERYDRVTLPGFQGVYYGQAALPLPAEDLVYLTNEATENALVSGPENPSATVYDPAKFENLDGYDVFLSGAQAVLTVENPDAGTDRTLVIFRDSYGSSLAPLLLDGYAKIILADVRYVTTAYLGQFVDFSDVDDVLLLYSTTVVNSAGILR